MDSHATVRQDRGDVRAPKKLAEKPPVMPARRRRPGLVLRGLGGWGEPLRRDGECGVGSQQTMTNGIGDSGATGVNAQLGEDVLDVGHRGLRADKQRGADLPV